MIRIILTTSVLVCMSDINTIVNSFKAKVSHSRLIAIKMYMYTYMLDIHTCIDMLKTTSELHTYLIKCKFIYLNLHLRVWRV